MYYPIGFDPTYILVIVGMLLCLGAQAKVKSTYARYSNVRNRMGITGEQAARKILQDAGIYDVQVEHVSGNLTDHFDPKSKVVRLSDSTFRSTSVAALGVAAHECGHVIQHENGYLPITIRSMLVPVANFGAQISWPLIIIGFLFNGSMSMFLIKLGILFFMAAVLFQIVTLPVEFNASSRAIKILGETGMLDQQEVGEVKQVLSAAALTYVAGAASAVLQLLRLILLTRGRRDD